MLKRDCTTDGKNKSKKTRCLLLLRFLQVL
jgi:hypothetical protein